jgi:hypothetical protein
VFVLRQVQLGGIRSCMPSEDGQTNGCIGCDGGAWAENSTFLQASGRWLLSSHEPLSPAAVAQALESSGVRGRIIENYSLGYKGSCCF